MGRSTRTTRLLASVAFATLVAAGCSGTSTIEQSELEETAAEQLADQVDNGVTPNISCPDDLDSEVGATITCDLSVEGDDAVYPVMIEVAKVEDGTASFSIEAADTPKE